MNFFNVTKLGRTLLLLTAVTVGVTWWAGCGDNNPAGNGGVPVVDPNTVEKGTFTDGRDGKEYKTVTIGTQTWMAENLNHETENSWCYDDADSNCVKYGRLYMWNSAMMACPNGWRLPDTTDWYRLMKAVGGRDSLLTRVYNPENGSVIRSFYVWAGAGYKLKSKDGWDGADDYGFSALPGGGAGSTGIFHSIGRSGFWWTASEKNYSDYIGGYYSANRIGMESGYNLATGRGYETDKDQRFSVRCIQNAR